VKHAKTDLSDELWLKERKVWTLIKHGRFKNDGVTKAGLTQYKQISLFEVWSFS
jgi:hypothetical protein